MRVVAGESVFSQSPRGSSAVNRARERRRKGSSSSLEPSRFSFLSEKGATARTPRAGTSIGSDV